MIKFGRYILRRINFSPLTFEEISKIVSGHGTSEIAIYGGFNIYWDVYKKQIVVDPNQVIEIGGLYNESLEWILEEMRDKQSTKSPIAWFFSHENAVEFRRTHTRGNTYKYGYMPGLIPQILFFK